MSIIYILYILTILAHFLEIHGNGLLKTDYYESLSTHKQCLIVSHRYPSSPLFLFPVFIFKTYSFIFGYESKNYYFDTCLKKIDRKCNNSIFIAIVKDFRKLDIKIEIYLFQNNSLLTAIRYWFYKGVIMGHYILWDIYQLFSVDVNIFVNKGEYLLSRKCNLYEIKYDLIKKRIKTDDICLLTENGDVILKPSYVSLNPEGFITDFIVYFFQNGTFVLNYTYPAFNCEKTESYHNEPFIFVIDNPKPDINYFVKSWKYSKGTLIEKEYEFKIYNMQYMYVNYIEYIPESYKKVFLLRYKVENIKCQDGSKRITYIYINRIPFYAFRYENVNTTSFMRHVVGISHSLSDPC